MRVFVNDKEVIIPSSLSEITLRQRIEFHNQYGRELDKMLESILKMPQGLDRELEEGEFLIEKMFRSFAFFAGVTPASLKESKFIDDVAAIYHSCLAVLFEDEKNITIEKEIYFKNEKWEIASPELSSGSKMKFGEFIDAKQIVKDMNELGKGNWEGLLRLCAIYLRKVGEPYKEEFVYPDSDRMKLMLDLPMDKALQVGFFLSSTTNFLINILKSSGNPELKAVAKT